MNKIKKCLRHSLSNDTISYGIKKVFENSKAFIAFITAGDPSIETTEALILEMAASGADLIEIGVPFSDPVAEGEVIQRASQRALLAGTTVDKIFDMVKRIRKKSNVPLAIMTYINPVFVYGTDKFMEKCNDCGIDGVIIPDLPFEEKAEILPSCKKYDISLISLIAPSSFDRISTIAAEAEGFVYCVSSMGVTGVRSEINSDISQMISLVKKQKNIPCAIGFGISTPEQARKMSEISDGVIVGSAIVKIVEEYGVNSIKPVGDYVKNMKNTIS